MMALVILLYTTITKMEHSQNNVNAQFKLSRLIYTMSEASRQRALIAHRMLLMDDMIDRFEEQENFIGQADLFMRARDQFIIHLKHDEPGKIFWDKVVAKVNLSAIFHNKVIDHLLLNEDNKALTLLKNDSKDIQEGFIKKFNKMLDMENKQADEAVKKTSAMNRKYLILTLFISVLGMLVFSIVSVYTFSYISKTEKSLKSAHDAELKVSEYKSHFMEKISHELRTPLNAIIGFSQVISTDDHKDLPAEYAIYFKHIEHAGWRLSSLVDNILDLTKISKKQVNLDIDIMSLPDLFDSRIADLAALAKEHEVTCSYEISELHDPIIYTDQERLGLILRNLLSNGIKYNTQNGSVIIRAMTKQNNTVRIEVENTGHGIKQGDMAMLFKPFSKVGEQKIGDGAGIGLVLAKELTELMGGQIGVYSEPGSKTLFWIEIPNEAAVYAENAGTTKLAM